MRETIKKTFMIALLIGLQICGWVFRPAQAQTMAPPTMAPATTPAADAKVVGIDNFSFSPESLEVPAGTTVTWVNHDDIPHTVVSNDKIFKSKPLDTDDKFSYTFTKPGTYDYFCGIHPHMTGKIIVK